MVANLPIITPDTPGVIKLEADMNRMVSTEPARGLKSF